MTGFYRDGFAPHHLGPAGAAFLARIPLGIAVTIGFAGPLAAALVGSRWLVDLGHR